MKIFNSQQIQAADQATIKNEPIHSLDLMERAAGRLAERLIVLFKEKPLAYTFKIFAGPGNNGGDGLVVARILHQCGYNVEVFLVGTSGEKGSSDFKTNYERIKDTLKVSALISYEDIPEIDKNDVVIDALFGSGLNRPPEGVFVDVINTINYSMAYVISVDIPSGLYINSYCSHKTIIKADLTYSFQFPKLAFLVSDNKEYVHKWEIIDIGLDQNFIEHEEADYFWTDNNIIRTIYKQRNRYAHKGDYGRILLITGSHGKMGASVLSSKSCMQSGAGLVTVHIPGCGYEILQTAVPEVMVSTDAHNEYFTSIENTKMPALQNLDVVAIGPGIGTSDATVDALASIVNHLNQVSSKPYLVLDADALNICSLNSSILEALPPKTVLTPHPKEFERLAGESENAFHRIEKLRNFCMSKDLYVILKDAYSVIGTPEGEVYFNSTGNPGMATAGSGDVLTGIVTALLGQKYPHLDALRLAVFVHGKGGDLACEEWSYEGITASDIARYTGRAFKEIASKKV